jgi:hypothetical protein
VSIPGFNLLRNDCFRERGGGVALYATKNLNSKCIFKSPAGSAVEILLAEIRSGPLNYSVIQSLLCWIVFVSVQPVQITPS